MIDPETNAPMVEDAELAMILNKVPSLAGKPRQVWDLEGGLTNKNYKVVTDEGAVVVRVSPTQADLLSINRQHEFENSRRAAAVGIGAPILDYLPEHSIMIVGYIDGSTFTDESFKLPGNIQRVASSCRRLHQAEPFVNEFNMFKIQAGYLRLVQDSGFRLPNRYTDYLPHVAQIQAALQAQSEPLVPCNNDLLAGNFVDDGEQIWLIDYEYSGNNDPCFELGNVWSECHLTMTELEELITAYYGAPLRNRIARAQLQGLMSKYGWTLWGSIQQATSSLDFDFWAWAMEKYDAAEQMFNGPVFARLLEEVQRAD